jgi:hypothetical protein
MENLQTEVLELEFHEFSKGHDTITEVDFAKILLRYTHLDTDEYADCNKYCMTSLLFYNSVLSAQLDVILTEVCLYTNSCPKFRRIILPPSLGSRIL